MKKIWERIIPLSKADRKWDIQFWQAQSSTSRFRAAWQIMVDFHKMKNKKINAETFRLQKSVEKFKKLKWT